MITLLQKLFLSGSSTILIDDRPFNFLKGKTLFSKKEWKKKKRNSDRILKAALLMITEEGCLALSMRKIADKVEYEASIRYEVLSKNLRKIAKKELATGEKLDAMWLEYWNFSLKNTEVCKLMFDIQISCPKPEGEVDYINNLFKEIVASINTTLSEEELAIHYYSMWSLVHGGFYLIIS